MRTRTILPAIAGLLMAVGLSAPASAVSSHTIQPTTSHTVRPNTFGGSCDGKNDKESFWGYCTGTGPSSYRAVVNCANDDVVYGIARWDGDTRQSSASCSIPGVYSALYEDWGYVLCYGPGQSGYVSAINKHGDIEADMGAVQANLGDDNWPCDEPGDKESWSR